MIGLYPERSDGAKSHPKPPCRRDRRRSRRQQIGRHVCHLATLQVSDRTEAAAEADQRVLVE
jgi:hypothetical protein